MQRVVITGAYGVIGTAISEMMAEKGYSLLLVGRDPSKLDKVCRRVKEATGNGEVSGYSVDLSREKEVEAFARKLSGSVHVLINNAGTTPPERLETEEGIEMQWAVNVMSYVWMVHYLLPHLQSGGRVVNVASFYAGGLDMEDVEFRSRPYDNDTAYQQSKQANRMLSAYYAEELKGQNIHVNSCHPGEINSKLSNNLGFIFHDPPRKGADTPVWVATSPDLEGVTGKYFQYRKEIPCHFSRDHSLNQKLYQLCKRYFQDRG